MNFYRKEMDRIRKICYSNEGQIQTVIDTRKYIDHHFDKDLNLTLLSQTHFTSKFHLLRLFKKYYGLSPKQYQTDKRIEKSRDYLKNGMTVTDTCYAVGFESPASFSTLFRRKIGLAPAAFQKKQLSQSQSKSDTGTSDKS